MRTLRLLLALLTLAAPAAAQTAYSPNRLADIQYVADQCPGLINQDHAFTDAAASYLAQKYPAEGWGRNAKRGNANDPSHDALWYPTGASRIGGAIIDIIVGAGGGNASPSWQDKTDETIAGATTGGYIAPSGRLPACLSGGSTPPTGGGSTPPPPTSTPGVDLKPVLDALARVEARQGALEERVAGLDFSQPIDYSALDTFVRDMTGDGPDGAGPEPPHITDLKQRLDVLRSSLEQLTAWLRSRAVLRY